MPTRVLLIFQFIALRGELTFSLSSEDSCIPVISGFNQYQKMLHLLY